MDEWCFSRTTNALADVTTYPFLAVASDVVTTDLSIHDKGRVLIEARTGADADGAFIVAVLVNFDRRRGYGGLGITVRLPPGFNPTVAEWSDPGASGGSLAYNVSEGWASVILPSLDMAAAVVILGTSSSPGPTATLTPTDVPSPPATLSPTVTATGTPTPLIGASLLPIIFKDYR